jgi:hypothetical protein
VELGQVQADELWVKRVGQRLWMAMALAVPLRLWLGGVISPHRDRALIADFRSPITLVNYTHFSLTLALVSSLCYKY